MRKKWLITAGLVAMLAILLAGCASSQNTGRPVLRDKTYGEIMNEKLISFTDCADDFCGILDEVAEKDSAPSDSQVGRLSDSLGRLEIAGAALKGVKAPAAYAAAQSAMDRAMDDYAAAFEKGRALLDFYRGYDERFHAYKDPAEGRKEIRVQEKVLYEDFASAMARASDSFRQACEELDNVKTE